MRRGLVVVLGLLATAAATTTLPSPVQARDLPGALLGVITRPLGAIFGGPRAGRRSSNKARKASRPSAPVAAQSRPAIATPAAGAAAVGTAAAVTAATSTPSAEAKPVETKPAETKPAETKPAETKPAPAVDKTVAAPASPASTATPVAATTAPVAASPLPAVAPAPVPAVSTPAATAAVSEPKIEPKIEPKTEAKPETKPETKPTVPANVAATPAPAPAQRNAAVAQPAEARTVEQPPARQQPTAAPTTRSWLRLGMTGPLTWPTALEDVIGFTLWPGEYSERLRLHGIGDVLNTVMIPASAFAARLRPTQTTARSDTRQPAAAAAASSLGVCNLVPASEEWPIPQIERTVDLNAEQRTTLAQLKTAFGEAAVRIRAACRDEASPSSADRLRTMQATLWAVHDAAIQLRAPLAKFYGSLTDEQRQKFAAPASAQADPRSMTPAAIAKLCGAPQSNESMVRQAEQSLNLNRAQRASLDAFQKKSAEMGQFLMASCLRPVASTPVERIDAAADRLTALIFAASTVNLALNDFYNQLDDGQRSKFDSAAR
jgi:hypothetical protein